MLGGSGQPLTPRVREIYKSINLLIRLTQGPCETVTKLASCTQESTASEACLRCDGISGLTIRPAKCKRENLIMKECR